MHWLQQESVSLHRFPEALSKSDGAFQGVAMSNTALMSFRFFAQTPLVSLSPASFDLSPV